MEIWKLVRRNSNYEVSDLGRIRRITPAPGTRAGRILKSVLDNGRYLSVSLYMNGKIEKVYVHLLVAEAFWGPPPNGFEVNHKDGIKTNPCLSNLEYVTHRGNVDHAVANGLTLKGTRNGCCKLSPKQVLEIRELVRTGVAARVVADKFGITYSYVGNIVAGRKWGWLKDLSQLRPGG